MTVMTREQKRKMTTMMITRTTKIMKTKRTVITKKKQKRIGSMLASMVSVFLVKLRTVHKFWMCQI